MKKIVGLLVVLIVLFGCASIPQEQYDMLQGTWVREDGATITFNGRNWETVDLANGSAGYGTFEIRKDNRIQFTHTYIQNLKFPISDYLSGWATYWEPGGSEKIVEFQMRALEEFNRLYPERVLQYDPEKYTPENNYQAYGEPIGSIGGWLHEYIIEGNSLTVIQIFFLPETKAQNQSWLLEPFIGTFIRQ
jgi:hypothetical protein